MRMRSPLHALVFVLALASIACAGSLEEARLVGLRTAPPKAQALAARAPDIDTYCRELDDRRIAAGAWAKGSAVLAGVAGSSAGVVTVVDERGVPRGVVIGAGIVALGAAAFGAHQLFTAEGHADAWARSCR